jgi:hypothetical protein
MNDYSNEHLKLICNWAIGTRLLDAKLVTCYSELFMGGETYQKPRLKSVRYFRSRAHFSMLKQKNALFLNSKRITLSALPK